MLSPETCLCKVAVCIAVKDCCKSWITAMNFYYYLSPTLLFHATWYLTVSVRNKKLKKASLKENYAIGWKLLDCFLKYFYINHCCSSSRLYTGCNAWCYYYMSFVIVSFYAGSNIYKQYISGSQPVSEIFSLKF